MAIVQLKPMSEPVKIEPNIDLSFPEDVLIQAVLNPKAPKGWMVMSTRVINGAPNTLGAASYEEAYSGFLHYVIKDLIGPITEPGYYVIEGVNADFKHGSPQASDEDIRFFYQGVRPATPEEISLQ